MPILDTVFRKRYEVSQRRLQICDTCEHYTKRIGKCEKCGCFMEFKTLIMSAKCPEEKWKPENDG